LVLCGVALALVVGGSIVVTQTITTARLLMRAEEARKHGKLIEAIRLVRQAQASAPFFTSEPDEKLSAVLKEYRVARIQLLFQRIEKRRAHTVRADLDTYQQELISLVGKPRARKQLRLLVVEASLRIRKALDTEYRERRYGKMLPYLRAAMQLNPSAKFPLLRVVGLLLDVARPSLKNKGKRKAQLLAELLYRKATGIKGKNELPDLSAFSVPLLTLVEQDLLRAEHAHWLVVIRTVWDVQLSGSRPMLNRLVLKSYHSAKARFEARDYEQAYHQLARFSYARALLPGEGGKDYFGKMKTCIARAGLRLDPIFGVARKGLIKALRGSGFVLLGEGDESVGKPAFRLAFHNKSLEGAVQCFAVTNQKPGNAKALGLTLTGEAPALRLVYLAVKKPLLGEVKRSAEKLNLKLKVLSQVNVTETRVTVTAVLRNTGGEVLRVMGESTPDVIAVRCFTQAGEDRISYCLPAQTTTQRQYAGEEVAFERFLKAVRKDLTLSAAEARLRGGSSPKTSRDKKRRRRRKRGE